MENFITFFQSHVKGDFSILILLLCFLGGIVSSLSPCGIGMLPVVVSYIGASPEQKTSKSLLQIMFFILGLAISLTVIGVIAALTGQVFGAGNRVYFVLILTSLILIFGLNLIGLIDINFPVLVKKFPQSDKYNGMVYPLILGMVFAFATTPCSTPILAGIMAAASLSTNIAYAASMLFLFSLGQGMIILVAGLFTSVLKNLSSFARFSEILTKISGIILILFAIFLYYKVFSQFI
ncbi:MAG: cytochrome c biogenesis protein CcdA [Clostridium sp.]|nr:cytochrome c biogenesis protein CcdA [Clostridium sp.]